MGQSYIFPSSSQKPAEEFQSGPTAIVQSFVDLINDYSDVWEDRDESYNFEQKHDAELTRKLVFPMVEARIREQVGDEDMVNWLIGIGEDDSFLKG